MFQVFNLCFVRHWILHCQSLIENRRRDKKITWPPPPRQWQQYKFVTICLTTNIGICLFSKQIHGILGCSLDKSIDFGNFPTENNLTIVFYTVLTKIWFSISMIQAITHQLQVYCRKNWPKETISPNLHMLEDNAADFIGTWSSSGDVYGDQGAESIHKIFSLLQRA